jgi:hypothetical protein
VCYPPRIALTPNTKSKDSPAPYRRLQGFHIDANIKIACSASSSIVTEWTVHMHNFTGSYPIQIEQLVSNQLRKLYIPPRTFNHEVYKIELIVKMRDFPQISSSNFTYIRITEANITANLVRFGTSVITSGHKKDLLLDPGTHSVDPETRTFNASVSEKLLFYFLDV